MCSLDLQVRVAVRPTYSGGSFLGRYRVHPDVDVQATSITPNEHHSYLDLKIQATKQQQTWKRLNGIKLRPLIFFR